MGRQNIADIRRKEITEAFFTVVSTKGLANATIRDITKASGFSLGLLHHYFGNKHAMILGVMDYVLTTYNAELREGLSQYDSATDRMRFLISWFFDIEKFDLDFSRAWVEFVALSKTDPAVSKALRKCYRKIKSAIVDIIHDGIKSGEFRKIDPFITANSIMAISEGAGMLWAVDTKATPIKEMASHVTELFLSYLVRGK